MALTRRIESWLWGLSVPIRQLARRWRLGAFRWRHRLRDGQPRIVHPTRPSRSIALEAVAIATDPETRRALAESTWAEWSTSADAPFHLVVDGDPATLPATAVEMAVLASVAEGTAAVSFPTSADAPDTRAVLLRRPTAGDPAPALIGRHLATDATLTEQPRIPLPKLDNAWRRPDPAPPPAVVSVPAHDPSIVLKHRPVTEDPRRAVCFLLPYLAIGGAERLLFDLLSDWAERYRVLVVTLDAHRPELGSSLERCRSLTPRLYPLGDHLPRASRWPALIHLLRHHRVDTLVSWNGTVDFYDRVGELPDRVPGLRILAQLYHHRGGWAARTTPAVVRAVDVHLAVNRDLQRSLVSDRGVPADRIRLIHHGIPVPDVEALAAERATRSGLRRELDLPVDAIVVGSFIRLHPQKRPLDIVELARRIDNDSSGRPVVFLLVGGGPLEDAVDEAARHVPNLVRHPMVDDARRFYAAVDLCLMTSSYEGLPVFLLDALARELPIIAPAVGDIPLAIADGGGLVVDQPGDLDGLEVAIRTLLDEDERLSEGARGRRAIDERFGLAAYRSAYEATIFPTQATR